SASSACTTCNALRRSRAARRAPARARPRIRRARSRAVTRRPLPKRADFSGNYSKSSGALARLDARFGSSRHLAHAAMASQSARGTLRQFEKIGNAAVARVETTKHSRPDASPRLVASDNGGFDHESDERHVEVPGTTAGFADG